MVVLCMRLKMCVCVKSHTLVCTHILKGGGGGFNILINVQPIIVHSFFGSRRVGNSGL